MYKVQWKSLFSEKNTKTVYDVQKYTYSICRDEKKWDNKLTVPLIRLKKLQELQEWQCKVIDVVIHAHFYGAQYMTCIKNAYCGHNLKGSLTQKWKFWH